MSNSNGSMGEGGGQITAQHVWAVVLTGRAFFSSEERARGRSKPGLQPQHLMKCRAPRRSVRRRLAAPRAGSTIWYSSQGEVKSRLPIASDIGHGRRDRLVLPHPLLPLALRGTIPSSLTLIGGTHVSTSPAFHSSIRRATLSRGVRAARHVEDAAARILSARRRPWWRRSFNRAPTCTASELRDRAPVKGSGFSAVRRAGRDHCAAQARRAKFRRNSTV